MHCFHGLGVTVATVVYFAVGSSVAASHPRALPSDVAGLNMVGADRIFGDETLPNVSLLFDETECLKCCYEGHCENAYHDPNTPSVTMPGMCCPSQGTGNRCCPNTYCGIKMKCSDHYGVMCVSAANGFPVPIGCPKDSALSSYQQTDIVLGASMIGSADSRSEHPPTQLVVPRGVSDLIMIASFAAAAGALVAFAHRRCIYQGISLAPHRSQLLE
eukprot:TRINITY_DN68093_c0_g1_i1.p1 TRINITY_DN68093_c0_g1~~TRINITY_DN68093_c0_g1_i1.p1  ORF type:complete len:216 (-),score=24.78 TRINITY_DN68093_c0_g1_i1:84-731(-)